SFFFRPACLPAIIAGKNNQGIAALAGPFQRFYDPPYPCIHMRNAGGKPPSRRIGENMLILTRPLLWLGQRVVGHPISQVNKKRRLFMFDKIYGLIGKKVGVMAFLYKVFKIGKPLFGRRDFAARYMLSFQVGPLAIP